MNLKPFALCTILLATSFCIAQDYPKLEVAAGYSYGSVDTQGYSSQRGAQGWSGSLIANMRRWAGLEAEVSGERQDLNYTFNGTALTTSANYYSFIAGPRFAHRTGKVTPFIHGLFGLDRIPGYDLTVVNVSNGTSMAPFVNGLAAVAGGGMDVVMSRHWSFRTQADYFFTRHSTALTSTPNNFRVQAGLVFTFGESAASYARRHGNGPVYAKLPPPAPVHPADNVAAVAPDFAATPRLTDVLPSAAPAQPQAIAVATTISTPVPPTPGSEKVPEAAIVPSLDPVIATSTLRAAPVDRVVVAPAAPAPIEKPEAPAVATVTPVPAAPAPIVAAVTPVTQPENIASQPQAPSTVATVADNGFASDPHTVVISQGSNWQTSSSDEAPLGDVARQYRERKAATNSGF